jgi:hypothetical protein
VRHLGSMALAMLTAPLILVLAGRGLASFLDAAGARPADPLATATAVAALGLAGMLYALLTLPRLSPLGPALTGVGGLGVGLWALADLNLLQAVVRAEAIGLDDRTVALTAAVAPLLAVPLLLTVFSGGRWRGRGHPAPAPPAYGYPGYPPPPPDYGPPPPPPWHAPARPDATQEFPAVPVAGWPAGPPVGRPDDTPTDPNASAADPPTVRIPPAPPPAPPPATPSPPVNADGEAGAPEPAAPEKPSPGAGQPNP